jgi:ribonuclease HI
MTESIESIEPFIRPPWWMLKAKTRIEKTKDIAKSAHDKIQELPNANTAIIYTDGSGIDKKIGAAAYAPTSGEASLHHLGGETKFNVYTAEITAMQLALERLWNYQRYSSCCIYTDSQTAIKSIERPHRQSGQSIIKGLLDCIEEILYNRTHLQIEIAWIPGHFEIQGNERADMEAKKAAMDPTLNQLHKQKPLKSARTRYIKAAAKEQWHKSWTEDTKTAKTLRHITKRKGSKSGPKLYNDMVSRNTVTTIAQLRTGHCGLNYYLHQLGKKASPYCECGYGKETVEHYLLECRKYKEQRKRMRKEAGAGKMKVGILLGDPTMIKNTMMYVKETRRLSD